MSIPACIHGTFTLERQFAVAPSRVFGAWADPREKALWFAGPPDRWEAVERTLDFRVGGLERLKGAFADGLTTLYTARYHSIVPDRRVAYSYDMHVDGTHVSMSLVTAELQPTDGGCQLRFVEHLASLDGRDVLEARKRTAAAYLDGLTRVL